MVFDVTKIIIKGLIFVALIHRTIYPRFNKVISKNELIKCYTPSDEDISLAYKHVKGLPQIGVFLIMLKSFKKLNYFPSYKTIPIKIIGHIKASISIDDNTDISVSEKTLQKYRHIIRDYLNVLDNKKYIEDLIIKTVEEFELIMEHPADVFNAVIETLIKNNCELPAFSTLERLINNKRAEINNNIFESVHNKLSEYDKKALDLMLESNEKGISDFNYIKELPKSPTLNHMKEVKENFLYLKSINHGKEILKDIHPSKIKFFAAQGNVLDASEMKDFSETKRYTIILCLIYHSTVKTCDNLITMFIKRIGNIHNKGKEKLQNLVEKQRSKTENIIEAFRELLISSPNSSDTEIANNYRQMLKNKGGYEILVDYCEEISAYSNKNYFPLLWGSFRSHRKILLK